MNLLLIEDNLEDARFIRKTLKNITSNQFHIERAESLDAALKRISNEPFDVIISALDLPDSSCDEITFEICRNATNTPLIVLTVLDDQKLELNCIKAGAQEFLVKNKLDPENLSRAIRHSIERKHLDWQLRLARRRLRILHDTASKLVTCTMKMKAFKITIKAAELLLSTALYQIFQEQDGVLITVATSSELSERIGSETDLDFGLTGMTFAEGRTFQFESHDDKIPGSDTEYDVFRSGITIPIASEAVFQILSREPNAFTNDDTDMLEMLAGHLTGTIERITLERKLRNLAIHDSLTGVFNRNFFQIAISREKLRAERYNSRIGFLIVDIDNFKQINDLYGHQTGDRILKEVAAFLGNCIRETDFLIRYGGDEFLLILIETGQTALIVRERILENSQLAEITTNIIGTPVTLSIGNAHWDPNTGISIRETLVEADKQMYLHKRSK
ncbi:MAG: diguanylate cyclase [Candidatus Aegiribacteria sp.]|nr:diguanylate cyclase [Candidatus Aegiribacteria sp.]